MPNLCASAGFFLGGKTVGPTSTCSEGGKHDFSSSKGDAAGILSGLDIGELISLVFGGWMLGMVFWRMDARDGCGLLKDLSGFKLCSDRIWIFLVSH